jgi:hypothetical protein
VPESSSLDWRLAIRSKTPFWVLVSGLVNIDSALLAIRFARRDDSDNFFAIKIILPVDKHYEQ